MTVVGVTCRVTKDSGAMRGVVIYDVAKRRFVGWHVFWSSKAFCKTSIIIGATLSLPCGLGCVGVWSDGVE